MECQQQSGPGSSRALEKMTIFTPPAAAGQLKKDLGGPVKGFDDSTYICPLIAGGGGKRATCVMAAQCKPEIACEVHGRVPKWLHYRNRKRLSNSSMRPRIEYMGHGKSE